jgi:hypothetical protein
MFSYVCVNMVNLSWLLKEQSRLWRADTAEIHDPIRKLRQQIDVSAFLFEAF